MGRLREAAVQIGDLYDQVHLAEQEQDQLSTERRQAEDEAEHFLYGEAEAFQVRTEMIRKLAVGKQEHEQKLQALAHAESESYACWTKQQRAKTRSMHFTTRLAELSADLEDLWQQSEDAVEAREKFRGDWKEAVQLATVERGQVEEVHTQMKGLRVHAATAEVRAAELCLEAVDSEVASSELWQSLAKVEGQDHRRDALTVDLQHAQAEQEELRAHIFSQEQYDGELLAALAESEAQRAAVTESLQLDAVHWQEIRSSIQETRNAAAQLYSELTRHADGYKAVTTRHAEAEAAGTSRLQTLQSEFQEHAGQGQHLDEKAAQLEKESQDLQDKLQKAQSKKEDLVGTLAKKEQEHEELLVRKADLNAELEELKKKFRCVVS